MSANLSPGPGYPTVVARKPDPLRIYAARRAGLFSRLVAESKLSERTAELRLTAYEAHCHEQHLDARQGEWWDGFWPWWEAQRPAKLTRY
jgi:hypothetical protein